MNVPEPSGAIVRCSTLGVTVEIDIPFALNVTRALGNTEISRVRLPASSKKDVTRSCPVPCPSIANAHGPSGAAGIVNTSSNSTTVCVGLPAVATATTTSAPRAVIASATSLRMETPFHRPPRHSAVV